jgi:hypothetical protein
LIRRYAEVETELLSLHKRVDCGPSPKPLVVDDVTSLIGSHPHAKSRGLYSSVHHSAPASTCGLPISSIEWIQRWVSPEVFCRPAYMMVASSATLVKD